MAPRRTTVRAAARAPAEAAKAHIRSGAGADIEIETLLSRAPVYSPPDAPLATLVAGVAGTVPRAPLTYFTDASVLSEALGATETVFFGPGDAEAAHTVDESCPVERITAAASIYEQVLARWR